VFGRRLAAVGARAGFWPVTPRAWRIVIGVAAAALVLPVLAFGAISPLRTPSATRLPNLNQYAPANTFALSTAVDGTGRVVVRWPSQDASGARAGYLIFREQRDGLECLPVRHAASNCFYFSEPERARLEPVGRSQSTSFVDRPGPGRWIYRVAATISPSGPRDYGNYFLLSRPATVHVGA
jgi:hypothetical protein